MCMDPSFGAHESVPNGQEFVHADLATVGLPPESFSIESPFRHLTQNHIGICTAISVADTLGDIYGIPFSPQFIYVLGKVLFDGNRNEGSSLLTMMRTVNKYGACPASLVPTDDTTKSYASYINYWPTAEQFHAALPYKITYSVARLDPIGFAGDLATSEYGILTRMSVGKEWYTRSDGIGSYLDKDINPLRTPNPPINGHAVRCIGYQGLQETQKRTLRNTWGDKNNPIMPGKYVWARNGDIDYIYADWKPYVTEAWTIRPAVPGLPQSYQFNRDLFLGSDNPDVLHLQVYLNAYGFILAASGPGSPGNETTYYGALTQAAVNLLQLKNGIAPAAGYCGPKTRAFINSSAGL